MSRDDGRAAGEARPVAIVPDFVPPATGSALITVGRTQVICTASVEPGVPRWMAGSGRGWVTAEYGMLPASTGQRKPRDAPAAAPDGRTIEIQRLIGRALRGVVDFEALGERTVYLDCDVLVADGGTRCAAITGAYVAFARAMAKLLADGAIERSPVAGSVAAISVRDRRRRAAARPRLLRGLDRRGRRERRDDRRRRPRRGAGDGRAHAALARAPRRAARARRDRDRAAARGPGGRDRGLTA